MGRNVMSAVKRLIKRKSFGEKEAMPDHFVGDSQLQSVDDVIGRSPPVTRKEPALKLAEIEKEKVAPLKQKFAWLAEDLENTASVNGEERKKLKSRLKQLNESAMRLLEELDAIEISSEATTEDQYKLNRESRKTMVNHLQTLLDQHDSIECKVNNMAVSTENLSTTGDDQQGAAHDGNAIVECCA